MHLRKVFPQYAFIAGDELSPIGLYVWVDLMKPPVKSSIDIGEVIVRETSFRYALYGSRHVVLSLLAFRGSSNITSIRKYLDLFRFEALKNLACIPLALCISWDVT